MGEKTRLVETPKGVLMNPELGGDALPLAYDERAAVERDDEERQQLPTSQHHVPERAQTERNSPGHCGQHVKLTVFVYLDTHAWHSKALYLRVTARRNHFRSLCTQRLRRVILGSSKRCVCLGGSAASFTDAFYLPPAASASSRSFSVAMSVSICRRTTRATSGSASLKKPPTSVSKICVKRVLPPSAGS